MRRLTFFFAALFVLSLITTACGPGGDGGPSTPGQYSVQKDSVHFDGDRYQEATTRAYGSPPTGSFGRDESLHGSVDTSKPTPPDYSKIQPAPYATSAQAAGTGGGSAASNKSPGGQAGAVSGSTGATSAASGQAAGTGGGTAASSKGGFANGSQSFANTNPGSSAKVGAGSGGTLGSGGTSSKPSTGISGSKGLGGARAPSVGRR